MPLSPVPWTRMSGLLLLLLSQACRVLPPPGPPLSGPERLLTAAPDALPGAALAAVDADLLAVGAPGAGQVYLLDAASANVVAVLSDPAAGARLGRALAAPGDLDGDGHAELLIASQDTAILLHGPDWDAPSAPRRQIGEGVAMAALAGGVLLSAPREERVLWVGPDLQTVWSEVWGEQPGGLAGGALAAAGDLDGDGVEDVVVGAWGLEGFRGAAYLVLGPLPAALDLGDADARFLGERAWDVAGVAVAGGQDLDGDGRDDVWVGAHGHDEGVLLSAGAAYLLRGRVSLRGGSLRDADARLAGTIAEARVGWSLSAGSGGVVVGAPGQGGGWLVTPAARHRLAGEGMRGGEAVLWTAGGVVVGDPTAGAVWRVPHPPSPSPSP